MYILVNIIFKPIIDFLNNINYQKIYENIYFYTIKNIKKSLLYFPVYSRVCQQRI